jgi:DNA processing protein
MNFTEDRIARAALTRLFEPGDIVGRALVAKHGAGAALKIATGVKAAVPFWDVTADELAEGLRRWAPRIPDLHPDKDLAIIERLGGGFLTPDDERWPAGLNDLPDAPWGLWYRGNIENGIPNPAQCVALTGSRDSTSYGAAVTGDIAYGLAQGGICVVSGLAYGIDAHAHRAALAGHQGTDAATIAVLAGGLDRDYPSGNADLAAAIRANGLTLSELPPGSAPTRYRFLIRTTEGGLDPVLLRLPNREFVSRSRPAGSGPGRRRRTRETGRYRRCPSTSTTDREGSPRPVQ